MAEELRHLIERIQNEAVGEAEAKAVEIVAKAKAQAAALVDDARYEAKAIVETAKKDSEVYVERSRKTLEQAARDLLITVGQGVENILDDIVAAAVDQALDVTTVQNMLVSMAGQCALMEGETRLEILVSPEQQEEIIKYFADQYRKQLIRGVELHVDNEILKGFRVSFRHDEVYLDFTNDAIAEAMSEFLRPKLSRIVRRAADMEQNGGNDVGAE
ncbi:hypothetical protein [Desulfovibrio inopinatus]|uniref:hypothetical protein n=1 Tax=Desulfovibrio inopinatus TaxID=102109 RepID=UPI0003F548F4|nr:hypothetical protein [Desulfovibrio inopinatus]